MQTASARADEGPVEARTPTVLAVVVTHRGRRWLKHCLIALDAQGYGSMDVLVVDDASPDYRDQPHLKRIVKRHVRKRRWGFLRTPRPLGFGGAINWALSRVRTDADFLLFIHDDVKLEPDAVEHMVGSMERDQTTAMVGPKIVAWDDPDRLEEVGMAVDRFGYPYKGLEVDEIDLGQHDSPAEVFYVTSTCMLVRHEVFKRLRGWDARMRAFSEDLDLCWRARVAGHSVRVEPLAKARHAMALATGRRPSRFGPSRYYIRRNRLRSVAKNASTLRLLVLIPQFILLTFAEMLAFIVLRQPREIVNLGRALAWNLLHIPQTLSARARVQLGRKVSDRTLRRLTVKETTRLRSYVSNQAERLEEAWGRRAEFLSQRGTQARAMTHQARGLPAAIAVATVILLLLGFRHFLWAPQASVAELLPFPERATAMWRAYFTSWDTAGLGQEGSGAPAFFLLGIFPLLALGAAGVAQKLLILVLGAGAFFGAYRLMAQLVDRSARWVAALTYALGTVTYSALRGGSLGALVFAAAAPFALLSLLRFTGWVRPSGWSANREIASLALAVAVSASLVPGSLLIYLATGTLLALARVVLMPRAAMLRPLLQAGVGLAAGWVLLLPWSATWLSEGGPLGRLVGDASWRRFAAAFGDHGMETVLLGQTPDGPALFGLALPLLGLIAVLIAEGQRRRVALALWVLIVASGALVGAIAAGIVRPIVASPTEAGVIPALAFAALVGLALGAFRLDLPRRGLGVTHALAAGGIALSGFLLLAGLVPSLWRGQWAPGEDSQQISRTSVEQLHSFLEAEAEQTGQFRVLWVGERWAGDTPSAARPTADHFLSGPRGEVLSELFYRESGTGERKLHDSIAAIEQGATDRGGRLLGAFNIDYILLERGPGAHRWLTQRDLAVERSEDAYLVLGNEDGIARAGVYSELPVFVQALDQDDAALAGRRPEVERLVAEQESASRYLAPDATGPGVVFLAESRHEDWRAEIQDRPLQRVSSSWGNAWRVPASTRGDVVVAFSRAPIDYAWYLFVALAWVVALGGAFSKRRSSTVAARRMAGERT